ncbi:MAG: LytR C-terminal domain-containing protein [Deltaproteobacteria bacterium]|nr:LytR C-terminal domain-containing protein [Deltaproteobacteria bacterium]
MFRDFVAAALFMSLALVLSGCMVENSVYQKKVDEADSLGKEVVSLQQQNKALAEENEQLRQQVQKLSAERQESVGTAESAAAAVPPEKEAPKVAEEKIAEPPKEKTAETPQVAPAQPVPEKKDTGLKSVRLKVLSGNGKMSSAKKMAGKLTKLGYKVEVVGMATTPDYATDTVYYKSGFEKKAADMARKLGGRTITKPISWSSVFDIIVVAVR